MGINHTRRNGKRRLFKTQEGRILLLGLTVAFFYIVGLGFSWIWFPEKFRLLWGMTITNIVFGRAAGLSFGYAMNLSNITVLLLNMLIETLLVLLFYPLFVFSLRKLLVISVLNNIMERTRKTAETHQNFIRKFGIPGLLLFVWFPFWMTGPIVGCAIGFLLGLRPWLNIGIVLAGTYIAIATWALLLRELHQQLAAYSSFGPLILVAVIVLIVLVGYLLRGVRNNKNHRG